MAWRFLSSEVIAVDAAGNQTHDPAKATGYAKLCPENHRKPSRKKVLASAKKAVEAAKRVRVRK